MNQAIFEHSFSQQQKGLHWQHKILMGDDTGKFSDLDIDGDLTITGGIHVLLPEIADMRPAQLKQIKGPDAPKVYDLMNNEQIFGRTSASNHIINSSSISRQHLLLKKDGNSFIAVDLDSKNGIFLNGVRFHSATLYEGDQLQIGEVVFVFREGGQ